MKIVSIFYLVIFLFMCSCSQPHKQLKKLLVGTYTDGNSKGVNVFTFDTNTNSYQKFKELELNNPSYLALSTDNKFLFAITEGDSTNSKVYSFNDEYTLIDSVNVGQGPCFIEIDPSNTLGFTANYGEGSFSYFDIDGDGKLTLKNTIKFEGASIDTVRQSQSHIHTVRVSPNQNKVYVTDLGTDKIYRYDLSTKDGKANLIESSLKVFDFPAGSGPRHIEFHPTLPVMYVITELSGEVFVFAIDENGDLEQSQVVKADEFDGKGSADIHITQNGKYLYTSHRLVNDGISIFSVDANGEIEKIAYQPTGKHPRNFQIFEDKQLIVANRDSNDIEFFSIKNNGLLEKESLEVNSVSNPVYVKLIQE